MSRKRLFVIQTLLEALIPVIGYFEWQWDLSFILLFYLLDYVLAFGILIAKGRKRISYSHNAEENKMLVRRTAAGFLLMVAACAGIGLGVVFLQPTLSWWERILSFLAYKEFGIAQGYVLVPLILLNGIMLYRQQFLLPARYRQLDMGVITKPFVQQGLVLLGSAGVFLGVSGLIWFPEAIAVFTLIAGVSIYRWVVLRSE
jgi:hypothetical protein